MEFAHPSYCLVSFSRRQGNPRLFGSSLKRHYHYVTLSIKRAKLIRTDTDDIYDGSICGDIVEVSMSAAQFAELITTMNVGLGVPGTLTRLNNQGIAEPPDLSSEAENIQETFAKDLRDFSKSVLEQAIPRAKEILAKTSLTKADRAELLGILERVSNRLRDTTPFIIETFNEAVGKRVSAAKTEIDSLFSLLLKKTGLKALQGQLTNLLPTEDPNSPEDEVERSRR